MTIEKEFIKQILDCQWLQRCVQIDNLGFDVEYLNNTRDVEKNINATKWENICLDRKGDFTTYLFKNYKTDYNKYWNDEVDIIKKQYLFKISEKIKTALIDRGLSVGIIDDILMNLLSIFMLEYYSDYYSCDFYNKMLKIYLSSHLPCGWIGKYPDGNFLVY